MKYKPLDKVRIKSLDWYNQNKDEYGYIDCGSRAFFSKMRNLCGKIATIKEVCKPNYYRLKEYNFDWTDEMIEGLVEEETKNNNDMEEKETLLGWVKENDSLRLVPHKDYEIKHDGDNFYLVKKKKCYPKTYEECCKVLGYDDRETYCVCHTYENEKLFESLYRLKVCRDAYWKIAGEEMGLGKPWEPSDTKDKYIIRRAKDKIFKGYRVSSVLEFPTEEMRDAFYENFKELIEICKELL